MNDLPQLLLKCPASSDGRPRSAIGSTLTQADGSRLPFEFLKATVHVDWDMGEPVTVDLVAVGGIAIDAAIGLHTIQLNGKKYRLIEARESDDACKSHCGILRAECNHPGGCYESSEMENE